MENDIVFADEMDKAGVLILPPFLPTLGQKLLSIRYITYRSVKPYIEHLTLCSLYRDRNAPVEIAADSTRLETAVQP